MNSIATTNILEQVERICDYSELKTKKLLCRFLRFVVNETLEGRGDLLKGYTVGVSALGKDKDFDPEQDSLVRIHAGRLRRLLQTYYLEKGKEDHIVIQIPKGSYKPVFFYPEVTSPKTSRSYTQNPNLSREPYVAVLPFKNIGKNLSQEYFSFGFSEELSVELTKYEDLMIINCWQRPDMLSSENLYYKYGARYLVDGSIQKIDQELHIYVKLVDAYTGRQIWGEKYSKDLSLKNILDIQEDIADTVAKTIGSELGIIFQELAKVSTKIIPENLQVFDVILQFYYYQAHMSAALGKLTYQKLQQALCENPTSGVIYSMIAILLAESYALDFSSDEGGLKKATEFAIKGKELDHENHIVQIVFSFICFLNNDEDKFIKESNICLSRNIVSPLKLGAIGFHLSLYGYWQRGLAILEKVMNKDIGYPKYFHAATCLFHYRNNNYEDALSEANAYEMPGLFWGPLLRLACLGKMGNKKEAVFQKEELLTLKPDFKLKAKNLISRFVKEDELVEEVLDGLSRTGL